VTTARIVTASLRSNPGKAEYQSITQICHWQKAWLIITDPVTGRMGCATDTFQTVAKRIAFFAVKRWVRCFFVITVFRLFFSTEKQMTQKNTAIFNFLISGIYW